MSGDPASEQALASPHVMNGGGVGVSGSDDYSDARTVERLGQGPVPNEFIRAPALREPLH